MEGFNKNDFELFKSIVRLPQNKLKNSLVSILKKYGYEPIESPVSIMAEGQIPIALVAHMDTVFKFPPKQIFHDREQGVIWSSDGLGADDRAGVFGILQIIASGLKPHIIFTCDEETGGAGATYVSENKIFKDVRYIIELDRCGSNDCVFYNCDNEEFVKYVETFGFVESYGTFSDISIICPAWGIAGVNLSIGYEDEHSYVERLYTKYYKSTIKKVVKMLQKPSEKVFKYIRWRENKFSLKAVMCGRCNESHYLDDLIPVSDEKYNSNCLLCVDCCVDLGVEFCPKCGSAFITDSNMSICRNCRKEVSNDRFKSITGKYQ